MLTCEQVRVRYSNGAIGVRDVSLEVGPGQIVALLGANGAGKTTTVRSIAGFLRSERASVVHGKVTFLGKDVTNLEPHQMSRHGVALVAETRKLFRNLSVADNLNAIDPLPARSVRGSLRDKIFALFPVLHERREQLAGQLSGGEQQMLAIARALLTQPKVLLIDELTLGIHVSLHGPIFDVVKRLASEGTAVLLVTEETARAVAIADYCCILRSGVVADYGESARFSDAQVLAASYVGGES